MSSAAQELIEPDAPHAEQLHLLLRRFRTNPETGLAPDEATARLARFGPNELRQRAPVSKWRRFAGQFNQLVVWILIVAAIVSGSMGEWIDSLVILAIVLLNGGLGFYQEQRAAESLAALRRLAAPSARVKRGGESRLIAARDIVPGDVIELEAGDLIPADGRLLRGFAFRTQEAAMTGESTPVDKAALEELPEDTPLADRKNMVFCGTTAAAGKATAVAVATGMRSELGKIAELLERKEREPTPLERRLSELGRVLVYGCLALVAVVFAIHMLRGGQLLEVFLFAVSLAVAAVPEGLPGVVTICLAIGLQRMVRRQALIRKLASVETLGSVTCICSDKTGTLTRNEMTVREAYVNGNWFTVTGEGYLPHGEFLPRRQGQPVENSAASSDCPDDDLKWLLLVGARANNARLLGPTKPGEGWRSIGDPTEAALLVAAAKAKIDPIEAGEYLIDEIPFDPERRAMSVVWGKQQGGARLFTKGAAEVIVAACASERQVGNNIPLSDARRQQILAANSDMASRALRVLALAYADNPEKIGGAYAERNLTFAGLVGMIDPPRSEVVPAIEQCRQAGIRPIMITGDHPNTAMAIARELGLATSPDQMLTGSQLDRLSNEDLAARMQTLSVIARASAAHKLRIVDALRRRQQVVAMTGDGVNDAPAVEAADIGVAMGITGTEVTKDASDLVLLDDNFASIVNAVREGRKIYDNIQKVVYFLLSCNSGEVLFVFIAALLGWPAPLLAIQILWINLVTDGLPAVALAMEPAEPDVMCRNPRPTGEPMITWRIGMKIAVGGLVMAVVALVGFAISYRNMPENLANARATAFCILVFAQLAHSLGCRSQRYTLPELGQMTNLPLFSAIVLSVAMQVLLVTLPIGQRLFDVGPLSTTSWIWIAGLSLTPVTVIELTKLVLARRRTDARIPAPSVR